MSLSKPAYMAQFRMTSGASGGSYTWDSFEAELVRTSVPDGLRLDVGLDGANEWSLDRPGEGIFGLQNTLITDDLWVVKSVAPSNTASLEIALPTKGVEAFSFAVASPSGNLASPFMAMAVNGQDILSRTLSNIQFRTQCRPPTCPRPESCPRFINPCPRGANGETSCSIGRDRFGLLHRHGH